MADVRGIVVQLTTEQHTRLDDLIKQRNDDLRKKLLGKERVFTHHEMTKLAGLHGTAYVNQLLKEERQRTNRLFREQRLTKQRLVSSIIDEYFELRSQSG